MTSRILVYNKSAIPDTDLSTGLLCDSNSFLTFDNKYFTVSVQLCFKNQVPVEEICDTVEAFVYVVDEPESDIQAIITDLREFSDFLAEYDPAVKLLLINTSDPLLESEFLEWCVEHEFEFVKYIVSDSNYEDELMGQSEGVGRVRAALECHMWPYRTMKNKQSNSLQQADSVEQTDSIKRTGSVKQTDSEKHSVADDDFGEFSSGLDFPSLMEDDVLGGDFLDMFSNMMKMKETADQMSNHEERKKFAEQVAMSFWRAMGGSDDEL